MLTKIRRSKGFTLVELLLVVAILAVLAFLAVPAIAETIRNSRMRTCASNEKMVETNVWRYYADGIAAGLKVGTAAETVTTGVTIDDFDEVLEGAGTDDWPELAPYFTPGGPPKCPFVAPDPATEQQYTIQYIISDYGLADVFCMCVEADGDATTWAEATEGHLRAADRRDEGDAIGEFPGPD